MDTMARFFQKHLNFFGIFGGLTLLTHCAGPITPFGGLSSYFGQKDLSNAKRAPESTPQIKVSFSPSRQVLHQRSDFVVNIKDESGIPNEARVQLIYNGYDITDSFVSRTSVSSLSDDHRSLSIKFKNLKLPPNVQNQIEIRYARDGTQASVIKDYNKPECSISANELTQNTGPFKPPREWLTSIRSNSQQEKINPSLFAAIVAQESGFQSNSLSSAKALGLTQITPIADRQIASVHQDWPRYTSFESTPFLILKSMIISGHLDESHDWRLNPSLSIQGGVTYLGMVRKYWETPSNQEMLKLIFGSDHENQTQILLASYQSGPARVNAALKTYGKDYLLSEDLKQARQYVGRIMSYCYFFSREELIRED